MSFLFKLSQKSPQFGGTSGRQKTALSVHNGRVPGRVLKGENDKVINIQYE